MAKDRQSALRGARFRGFATVDEALASFYVEIEASPPTSAPSKRARPISKAPPMRTSRTPVVQRPRSARPLATDPTTDSATADELRRLARGGSRKVTPADPRRVARDPGTRPSGPKKRAATPPPPPPPRSPSPPEQRPDGAQGEFAAILSNPVDVDAYHALRERYEALGQWEKAWCVARTLVALGRATSSERSLFEDALDYGDAWIDDVFSDGFFVAPSAWRLVYHRDQDERLRAFCRAVWRGGSLVTAQMLSKPPDKRGRFDPVARVAERVAQAFGLSVVPDGRLDHAQGAELQVAHCAAKKKLMPALIAGPHSANWSRKELLFRCARAVALLRPEHYLCLAAPEAFEELCWAVALVSDPSVTPPTDRPFVSRFRDAAGRTLTAQERSEGSIALRDGFLPAELTSQSARAINLSCNRMAFLLCDDLRVAIDAASRAGGAVSFLANVSPEADAVADLVLYSVSEEYFAARSAIGLRTYFRPIDRY